jgi:hypothetical protein
MTLTIGAFGFQFAGGGKNNQMRLHDCILNSKHHKLLSGLGVDVIRSKIIDRTLLEIIGGVRMSCSCGNKTRVD